MKKYTISISALLSVLLSAQTALASSQPPALPPLPGIPEVAVADNALLELPSLPDLELEVSDDSFSDDLPELESLDNLVDEAKAEIMEEEIADAKAAMPEMEELPELPDMGELPDMPDMEDFPDVDDMPEVTDVVEVQDEPELEEAVDLGDSEELVAEEMEEEAIELPEVVEMLETVEMPEVEMPEVADIAEPQPEPEPEEVVVKTVELEAPEVSPTPNADDELSALFASEGLAIPDVVAIENELASEKTDVADIIADIKDSAEIKRLKAVRNTVSARSLLYNIDNKFVVPSYMYTRSYSAENKHLPSVVYDTDLDSNLVMSSATGDLNAVRALLNRGVNVDAVNSAGSTPLMAAVLRGQTNVVHLLILRGADVNVANKQGVTALHVALDNNQTRLFRDLLYKKANVNAVSRNGTTTLMRAALVNNTLAFKALLIKGADIHALTPNGVSVLHIAAQAGNTEIVKLLLEKGLTPNMLTRSGISAEELARKSGYADTAAIISQSSQRLVDQQRALVAAANAKKMQAEARRQAEMAAMRAAEQQAEQQAKMAVEIAAKKKMMVDHEENIRINEALKQESFADQRAEQAMRDADRAAEKSKEDARAKDQLIKDRAAEMEARRQQAAQDRAARAEAAAKEIARQALAEREEAAKAALTPEPLDIVAMEIERGITEAENDLLANEIDVENIMQVPEPDVEEVMVEGVESVIEVIEEAPEIEVVEDAEEVMVDDIEPELEVIEEAPELEDVDDAVNEVTEEVVDVVEPELDAVEYAADQVIAEAEAEIEAEVEVAEAIVEDVVPVIEAVPVLEVVEDTANDATEEMVDNVEPDFDADELVEEAALDIEENASPEMADALVEEVSDAAPTLEIVEAVAVDSDIDDESEYASLGKIEREVWDLRFANWLKVDSDFDNLTYDSKVQWNKRHKMLDKTYGTGFKAKMRELGAADVDAIVERWNSLSAPKNEDTVKKNARRERLNNILAQWTALNKEFHNLNLSDKIAANNARHKMMGKLLDYESDSELADVFMELSELRRQELRASMIKWDVFEREVKKAETVDMIEPEAETEDKQEEGINTEMLPDVLPDSQEPSSENTESGEHFYVAPGGDLLTEYSDEAIDAKYAPSAGGNAQPVARYTKKQALENLERQLQPRTFKPKVGRNLSRMEAIHAQPGDDAEQDDGSVSPSYLVDELTDLLSAL